MRDPIEEIIEKELLKALNISEQRIALLDAIRTRPNKRATPLESKWLSNHPVPVLSEDIIALMLEAKADKRQQKNRHYQPFLLIHGAPSVDEFQYKISELLNQQQPFHYDFIIKNGGHCTPMQFEFDGSNCRVFYLDAAGDERNLQFASLFGKQINFYPYIGGGIQADRSSCSVFSIQHLNTLSNVGLKQKMRIRQYYPNLLDPVFLKNIQGTKFLKDYYKQHQNETIDKNGQTTLQMHIENYSITVDVAKTTLWNRLLLRRTTATQNHAISYKTHKYLLAAQEKFQELKRNSMPIHSILMNRKTCLDKNTVSYEADEEIYLNMMQSWLKDNDLEKIKNYIFLAMDPNYPQILKGLLNLGIGTTLTEVLSSLKSKNLNMNTANTEGNTLMMCATHFGNLEAFNALYNLGISLTEPRSDGTTPLMLAGANSQWDILQRMKELRIDLNALNANGINLAMILAEKGNIDLDKFQKLGVNFEAIGANGITPAFIAAQNGHLDMMSFLLDSPSYQEIPFHSNKDSLQAFANQYDSKIKSRMNDFIQSKAHSNSDEIEMLPEEIAFVMGHVDIIKLINAKRTNALESMATNSEELIARKLLSDLRKYAQDFINSDDLNMEKFLSTCLESIEDTKKQINELNLPPRSRALFQLLIKDIEKDVIAIAPYNKMSFRILEFMTDIAKSFKKFINSLASHKSTTTQYKEAITQRKNEEHQSSDFSPTNKKQ